MDKLYVFNRTASDPSEGKKWQKMSNLDGHK